MQATGESASKVVYSLACPTETNAEGLRMSGCGKGWTSDNATEPCSTCGLPSVIRDRIVVTTLPR